MRIMALDYGDARTGVAISDAGGILCGETLVIAERDAGRLAERAAQNVAREYAKAFPQLAGKFSTHICHSADGIQP